jgi:CRP-like cAMP-binding protein/di/tricarboxylate transporter
MEPGTAEDDPREAAETLAAVPLFAALTPLDRAKLAAALEARWISAGEVVFEAGGEGDALYVLRSGIADRRVAGSSIGTIEPPDVFGELALLTDEPRSASIVALTPLRVWALPRSRFHRLLESEPGLLLRLSAAISRRLAETRTALGELQRELDAWVTERLGELPLRQRDLVERGTFLDRLDPSVLAELAASDPGTITAELADLAARSSLVVRDTGGYRMPAAIRAAVLRRLAMVQGHAGVATRRRQAARALEARGALAAAIELYVAAGAPDEARRLVGTAPRRPAGRLPAGVSAQVDAPDSGAGPVPRASAPAATILRGLRVSRRLVGGVVAALLVASLWWTPPAGLGLAPWRTLVVLIAGAVLLALDVLPDAIVVLLMALGWVVPGLVEPRIALAGFASPLWLLVLSVLAIGVAVGNTGLLYRAALVVLTRAPSGFGPRALLLALVGTLVTPTLPNATSRMALAAPVVRELADALGYAPGSPAAAGLALAALVGFGQMASLFLTGSSVGLLVHGLLPPEVRAQFGFGAWLLAALPVHVPLFGLAMAAVVAGYRPEPDAGGGAERLALQRAVLGPPRRGEWLALTVLLALVTGFLTEPLHGVDAAWLAVAALAILVAGGLADATTLRTGIHWPFLVFFGVITSLGGVFRTLAIDRWLAEALSTPLQALAQRPAAFCLGLALTGFALSLVIRWQAAAPLLTLVATPPAATIGIHPLVVALVALVATQAWFLPFQSTIYLALHQGSGELFAHAQARRLALLWGPIVLLSLVIAVPVWRHMGLVR